MYRNRKYGSRKYNQARAKLNSRAALSDKLEPVFTLPKLRRRIIIEDFDTGEMVRHEILLHKTNRIDCYEVILDGLTVAARLGWSRILEKIRKAFFRISLR